MPKPEVLTVRVYPSRSKDPKQKYRWNAKTANGRKVANGGEGYVRWEAAQAMAKRLLDSGGTAFTIRWIIEK